jgi:hypothetical protein
LNPRRILTAGTSEGAGKAELTLTLLVTRLGAADNPQNPFATHNFTAAADLLNRCTNFHVYNTF